MTSEGKRSSKSKFVINHPPTHPLRETVSYVTGFSRPLFEQYAPTQVQDIGAKAVSKFCPSKETVDSVIDKADDVVSHFYGIFVAEKDCGMNLVKGLPLSKRRHANWRDVANSVIATAIVFTSWWYAAIVHAVASAVRLLVVASAGAVSFVVTAEEELAGAEVGEKAKENVLQSPTRTKVDVATFMCLWPITLPSVFAIQLFGLLGMSVDYLMEKAPVIKSCVGFVGGTLSATNQKVREAAAKYLPDFVSDFILETLQGINDEIAQITPGDFVGRAANHYLHVAASCWDLLKTFVVATVNIGRTLLRNLFGGPLATPSPNFQNVRECLNNCRKRVAEWIAFHIGSFLVVSFSCFRTAKRVLDSPFTMITGGGSQPKVTSEVKRNRHRTPARR